MKRIQFKSIGFFINLRSVSQKKYKTRFFQIQGGVLRVDLYITMVECFESSDEIKSTKRGILGNLH